MDELYEYCMYVERHAYVAKALEYNSATGHCDYHTMPVWEAVYQMQNGGDVDDYIFLKNGKQLPTFEEWCVD